MTTYPKLPTDAMIEARSTPEPNCGCWLWDGALNEYGHGYAWFDGRVHRAHRLSWQLHFGEIPSGLKVLHKCGVPACVNPAHLFIGSHDGDADSKIARGLCEQYSTNNAMGAAIPTTPGSAMDRLLRRCIPEPNSGCWLWIGALISAGYGGMRYGKKFIGAHRVSYILHHGPIPDGLVVRHKCDVMCCVNPDHLTVGTQQDNINDCVGKKRHAWGERQSSSKLTIDDVLSIRKDRRTLKEIKKSYNISLSTVDDIVNYRTWKLAGDKRNAP